MRRADFVVKIGDAMDEARKKAQEGGTSLVKTAESAATDAKRSMGKATTAVAKRARAAKATVKRKAKSAGSDAKKMLGKAKRAVAKHGQVRGRGCEEGGRQGETRGGPQETHRQAQSRCGEESRGTQIRCRQIGGAKRRGQGQDGREKGGAKYVGRQST